MARKLYRSFKHHQLQHGKSYFQKKKHAADHASIKPN
jgi:hypothetical protein